MNDPRYVVLGAPDGWWLLDTATATVVGDGDGRHVGRRPYVTYDDAARAAQWHTFAAPTPSSAGAPPQRHPLVLLWVRTAPDGGLLARTRRAERDQLWHRPPGYGWHTLTTGTRRDRTGAVVWDCLDRPEPAPQEMAGWLDTATAGLPAGGWGS